MYPHERSLVTRMKDRPFVLLGVNSDRDREKIKQVCKDKGLAWRSWWCGTEGVGGAIPRRWNVSGWPTIYVIDHRGVIRARNVRGAQLDKWLDQLVEEAERTHHY